MKKKLQLIVALLIMISGLNCSKDGDSNPPPVTPPSFTISNLQYNPNSATIKPHLPSFYINGTVNYSNAKNGISQLRITTSLGGDLTVPVPGASQSSGTIAGIIEIAMPTKPGNESFQVWLVDGNGSSSNKLTGNFAMTVNADASGWLIVSQQYPLWKVAWVNNKYLALGEFGSIMSSVNGAEWTKHNSGTDLHSLHGVCWTGTQYVVVGSQKTILTSPDGVNWTTRSTNFPGVHLQGVASSGNNIVAVGWNSTNNSTAIFNSTDGINWTNNDFVLSVGELSEITWAGGRYVAVGKSGGYPAILTSPDGITWTNRSGNTVPGHLVDIAYSGSRYTAVGYSAMATSADGVSWNIYSNPSFSAPGVTWSGSKFVAASMNFGIYSSVDGLNWTKTCDAPPLLSSITWSGVQYVAVGSVAPLIMISPN
ncbi:MAG TPA: hypothetical protein VFX58_13140 [Chitinophagaceae bacterium]|nr:hypothetical protein [Chitinophagaceae bacterium]